MYIFFSYTKRHILSRTIVESHEKETYKSNENGCSFR